MNLTRLLNTIADCRAAVRLAGFSPAEADRIVVEGFKDALNRIATRPYPQETDHAAENPEWTDAQAQTIESEGEGDHAALLARVVEATRYSVRDLETISKKAAQSRLYGMDENQAFTLMLIAESEGLHPIQALKRYHIIEGRPSMRADAMQAEFQRHGGRLRWLVSTGDECTAEFWHPQYHPEPFTVRVTMKELVDSEVAMQWPKRKEGEPFNPSRGKVLKTTYKQYPRQMLRARAISEGVRAMESGAVDENGK